MPIEATSQDGTPGQEHLLRNRFQPSESMNYGSWCELRSDRWATPIGLRSVSHNVHLICLFHAAGKGTEQLKRGTQCVFAMHRLWSRLPESQYIDVPDRTAEDSVETWPCFAALVLRRMLSADSAETVSAALRGLSAVVEVVPGILRTIFDDCESRERSWLLLGMEVWSARHPEIADRCSKRCGCKKMRTCGPGCNCGSVS